MAALVLPFIPKWVTPNMVTIFRFLLIPFVVWRIYLGDYATGLPLFVFAAFTDVIDGSVARLRNQVTTWGTFYDPLADKLLIAPVALLVVTRHASFDLALVMALFEILIGIGAVVWRRRGQQVSANNYGKTKMVLQVVGVSLLIISVLFSVPLAANLGVLLLFASIGCAVVSLFTYGI